MDKVRVYLIESKLEVFAPYYDALMEEDNPETRKKIFEYDTAKIRWADFIVAVVDYFDPGTIFEWGYAYGINKPIIAYCDDPGIRLSPMLEQSCTSLARGMEQLKDALAK